MGYGEDVIEATRALSEFETANALFIKGGEKADAETGEIKTA